MLLHNNIILKTMVYYILTFMSVGHVACGQIYSVLIKCDYIQGPSVWIFG